MKKRPRESRVSDGTLSRLERKMTGASAPVPSAPALRITPALWENIQEAMRDVPVPSELAQSVNRTVDRRALIQAVMGMDFENELFRRVPNFDKFKADEKRVFRWLLLCRVRAAMDELREMSEELEDATAPVFDNDPRNAVPVSKKHLWSVAHPGQEPKHEAEVSRWFKRYICGPSGCDPTPPNPSISKQHVTVNLRLFAALAKLPLDEVKRQLP